MFETVAEAQRRARKRLPESVYSALLAGTEKGLTVSDNVAAFDETRIRAARRRAERRARPGHDCDGAADLASR